jgi:signal transduction histidine kinase/CheY-like chemotaxis protein
MKKARLAVPWAVLVISLALTFSSTFYVLQTTQAKDESRFLNAVESAEATIEGRLETYVNILRAGAALFAADRDVTRAEFAAFVERLQLHARYPGIQGIGFSARYPREELDHLLRRARADGIEGFRPWPPSDRSDVHAILYLEPLDRRNQAAIGYDMHSDPTRRDAMDRARDSGLATMSGRVVLVQEIDARKQAGFLIYVPIYRSGFVPATIEERRRELIGFVYAPFRAGDLFRGIFGNVREPRVDFEIYDGGVLRPDALIYRSSPRRDEPYEPRFTTMWTLEAAGRVWTMRFHTRPEFDRSSSRNQVYLFLFGGLFFTAALFWMTRKQARAHERAARLYDEAKRERGKAEAANRAKDEFLATISHELRTPMTSILGWSSLLIEGGLPPEDVRPALDAIHRSSRVQAELIDDLLDLSRISSGKLQMEPEATDMNDVVATAATALRQVATEKTVGLTVHPSATPAPVWGDSKRLGQVVMNLLSNAVKFTPAGGRVDVGVRIEEREVVTAVTDTGIGIAPEFIPRLFQRFQQADPTSTRSYGGLGIGLSIVQHLTELHGGHATARSEGPGRGSTFEVRLPLLDGDETGTDLPSAPATAPRSLDGLRVLLVEDEDTVREFSAAVLRQWDAEVLPVASAREALNAIASTKVDFIVSDIAMPGEDGCALLRKVRAMSDTTRAALPAVALTAYGRSEDRARILAAGFDDWLKKPVEPHRLVAAIVRIVDERRGHATERREPPPERGAAR